MISYEEAMAKAADEHLALDEAAHFLALATEIRVGIDWRLSTPMSIDQAVRMGIARPEVSLPPDYDDQVAKAEAAHDPSGDVRDLSGYAARIGDAQTETMPLVSPVRQPVVDAVTERMTLPEGDRACMYCGMAIYGDGYGLWRHKLSNQQTCYQRHTTAWPAAVDDRG